ncbi:MAG: nucleotide exchange factor GrpE, partial [Kiritimatiellae bacterium]|nr:nucleotide exchange factor GrpE [Kiritimatiellia bacterium]
AAGAADATAAAEAEAPAPDAAALAAALAEEKDRNVRLYADFENFRRRMERERLETWARAERDVLSAVLPIADNFDRAMAQAGDDPFSEGVRLVHASLLDFLKKHEVAAIETVGKPFDPAIHEAVAYQPSPGAPEGTVIYETRKGYKAGETVLRPASVIVSSGKPEA